MVSVCRKQSVTFLIQINTILKKTQNFVKNKTAFGTNDKETNVPETGYSQQIYQLIFFQETVQCTKDVRFEDFYYILYVLFPKRPSTQRPNNNKGETI